MAGTVSKLRLVARCAVISIPKDVREAAGWEIGQPVVCEAVKLERGDVRVVISEASEEELQASPMGGRGSKVQAVRKVQPELSLFDMAQEHRAKSKRKTASKSPKVSFARKAQVHDGGERRVKAPRVRMQGERRAIAAKPVAKPVVRKGKAAKTKRTAKRHTAKRVVVAKPKRTKAAKRTAKRVVKRAVKRTTRARA